MTSSLPQKTVLITGCSDGGLGSALCIAFHAAGLKVYATARNTSKMSHLSSLGIETLTLDVQSALSIAECVSKMEKEGGLDILVNNAGQMLNGPISDLDIKKAKELFDLNVWSYLEVTQAFLPLLLNSKGTIINQTSIGSVVALPFQAAYDASKAAMAMFSAVLRLELQPFGITVIDLKTGVVNSNLIKNQNYLKQNSLKKGSIYEPAREAIEKVMLSKEFEGKGTPAEKWAREVVGDVLRKNPPAVVWRGDQAGLARMGTVLPFGMLDGVVKKLTGIDAVEQKVGK